MAASRAIILCVFSIIVTATQTEGSCSFPDYLRGTWFYMEDSPRRTDTLTFSENNVTNWKARCTDIYTHERPPGADPQFTDQTFLLEAYDRATSDHCYYCIDILQRSANVLQFRTAGLYKLTCVGPSATVEDVCAESMRQLPDMSSLTTMIRQGVRGGVSCSPTLEPGSYQFAYNVDTMRSSDLCNHSDSRISAPAARGDSFTMDWALCDDSPTYYNNRRDMNFKCIATWSAMPPSYTKAGYGALGHYMIVEAINVDDQPYKYKCLVSWNTDAPNPTVRDLGMSWYTNCDKIYGADYPPVKLVLTKRNV